MIRLMGWFTNLAGEFSASQGLREEEAYVYTLPFRHNEKSPLNLPDDGGGALLLRMHV